MEQEEPQQGTPQADFVADHKLLRQQFEKFLEKKKKKREFRQRNGYPQRGRYGRQGKLALERERSSPERRSSSPEHRSLSPKKRNSSPVKPSRSEEESSSRSKSPRRSHTPPRNNKRKEKEYIPPDAKNAPTPYGWQRSECPVGHRCNKALCYTHKRIQGAVWDRSRFPKPYYPKNKTRE